MVHPSRTIPLCKLIAKIVIADPNTRVVVLSASAGVTNLLVALANGVEAEERSKLIGEVRQIQENILNELKMTAVFALSSKNT